MKSPLAASRACTTLPGFAMNMIPSYTTGVVCETPGSSPHDQASRKSPTLSRSIRSSGLYPQPSRVRRQLNQSAGSGFCKSASVTGVNSLTCARTDTPATRTVTRTSVLNPACNVTVDLLSSSSLITNSKATRQLPAHRPSAVHQLRYPRSLDPHVDRIQ